MNEPAATGIFRIGPVHQADLPSTLAMREAGIFMALRAGRIAKGPCLAFRCLVPP